MIVTLKKPQGSSEIAIFLSRNFNINCTDVDFNNINFPEYLFLCLLSFRMPLLYTEEYKNSIERHMDGI